MPPIAKKGCGACAAAWAISSSPTAGPPRFRRRLPDRPDADVVDGALGGGGDLLLGVGREADDRVGPEQLPRLLGADVVLADVDAVGVAAARQVGIVVDDEEGAVGVGDAAEGLGGALDLRPAQLLLAQLDDVGAAAQRRAQQRFEVARRPGVADEVEAGGPQPLAAQRAVALGQATSSCLDYGRRPSAGRGGGVASEGHGSPRGLRGWHRGHRPYGPDPGNAGGGKGFEREARVSTWSSSAAA